MTLRPERQRILRAFLDTVWSEGGVQQCDNFIADTYRIHHDPGDPWEGQLLSLNGFKERVRISRAPFPDQRFDPQAWFDNPDGLAVTWLWSATHAGDLPGFPASGRRMAMSGATAYYFNDDNRITGHWQITDRLGIYRQLQQGSQG